MSQRWERPWYRQVLPERDIAKYLSIGETPILDERPSFSVWLWEEWLTLAVGLMLLPITIAAADVTVTKVALLMWLVLLVRLVRSFLVRWCTRYVLTDHRAIHLSGILTDRVEWMSWKKVTDVSIQRTLGDRMMGTATIKVQSANEASGFKAMKGVREPLDFAQLIADLVNEAHGPIILTPDPRRIDTRGPSTPPPFRS
ncbi:MAG: PH domain-containing protein [Actinobacteria bacterium]|nr:PH domain-containing protein [Actinomycetota bacterium]